ncbi:MAG: PIG-L family deacetylase [Acetobacteraceae bacterium]
MLTAGEAQRTMAALPVAELPVIIGHGDPLVLAPHPDDESLGCGGLLAEAVARGLQPFVLVLTDGTGSHPNSRSHPPDRLRRLREAEAAEAVAALGLGPDRIGFLRLPDRYAPTTGPYFDAAVAAVLAALARARCTTLLAPWQHDPHSDHLAAHHIARAAARQAAIRLLAYPVWGWMLPPETELDGPAPEGWRLDIARHLPAKRRAIAAHRSQLEALIRDDPTGFRLPAALLARFDVPFETYLPMPP